MSDEAAQISELDSITDPKSKGILVGYRSIIEQIEHDNKVIQDKITHNKGVLAGANTCTVAMQAYIKTWKQQGEDGNMEIEEVKHRRDIINFGVDASKKVYEQARKEIILLDGERRAMLKQLAMIKQLIQKLVISERRTKEIELEQEEDPITLAHRAKYATTENKPKRTRATKSTKKTSKKAGKKRGRPKKTSEVKKEIQNGNT